MLFRNMRSRGPQRRDRGWRLAHVAGAALLIVGGSLSVGGCAHGRQVTGTAAPSNWERSSLLLASTEEADEELRVLRLLEDQGSASAEIARLGRLYDLFDCARFTGNVLVRDAFWTALGTDPAGSQRGRAATVVALEKLLEEAWRIEDRHAGMSESQRLFLADFVALVSVDMFRPEDEDALDIQSDAFRRVATSGAPGLRDNAQWRIYDYVRGVIRGANTAPVERRHALGVHALYVTENDPEKWLSATRDHERPPWPTAAALLVPLIEATEDLRSLPPWTAIMSAVEAEDRSSVDAFNASYPPPRDSTLPLPLVPRGTGSVDDDSPMLWVSKQAMSIAGPPGRRSNYQFKADEAALVTRLSSELAKDGRGILLVGSEAKAPSATLSAALRAVTQSGASTIRFAVHEQFRDASRHVLTALPVQVMDPTMVTPGTAAFAESRIELHLKGEGLTVFVDGDIVAEHVSPASGYAETFAVLRAAFPRVETVRLQIASDTMYLQVVDLLQVLIGGTRPAYRAVGLLPVSARLATTRTQPNPTELVPITRAAWDRLRQRAARALETPSAINQSYPLREIDQRRVALLGTVLSSCLPDLQRLPRATLSVTVVFDEGHVHHSDILRDAQALRSDVEFKDCVRETTGAVRLRAHRERLSIEFVWTRKDLSPPSRL